MINAKVAVRYSKALFGLAQELKLTDQISSDMKLISDTVNANRELGMVLQSPIIKPAQKENVLTAIFNSSVNPVTIQFLTMLTRKGRSADVSNVAEAFNNRYLDLKGIAKAQITTATALDADTRAAVASSIKAAIGKEIELTEKVNSDLIGGFIIRVGDKQDDTSLQTKIGKLRRAFKENPYVKDY
jgi:F-type H+-transporting ATPase subunit delta